MNYQLPGQSLVDKLKWTAVYLLIASIVFHWRAISSCCIGILIILHILSFQFKDRKLLAKNTLLLVKGFTLLFIISSISLAYSENQSQGLTNLRIQSALVLVPLAIIPLIKTRHHREEQLKKLYLGLLLFSVIYLIAAAVFRYQSNGNINEFFYHQLVSPFHQHAVYFSLLVLMALILLLESIKDKSYFISKVIHLTSFFLLSGLLFLLSSKLVLILYAFYLLWFLFDSGKTTLFSKKSTIACCLTVMIAGTLLLSTRNPVSSRFKEINNGDVQLIKQNSFTPNDYFNGLQFRLLQWRFVGNILTEQRSWVQGVGIGDGQDMLERKYIQSNMYTGNHINGNRGYLKYNTHNQWLQTILQTGMIGLAVLTLISVSLIVMAINNRDRGLSILILSLLAWLFTESVFETQYGILIFSLFPLLIQITGTSIKKQSFPKQMPR